MPTILAGSPFSYTVYLVDSSGAVQTGKSVFLDAYDPSGNHVRNNQSMAELSGTGIYYFTENTYNTSLGMMPARFYWNDTVNSRSYYNYNIYQIISTAFNTVETASFASLAADGEMIVIGPGVGTITFQGLLTKTSDNVTPLTDTWITVRSADTIANTPLYTPPTGYSTGWVDWDDYPIAMVKTDTNGHFTVYLNALGNYTGSSQRYAMTYLDENGIIQTDWIAYDSSLAPNTTGNTGTGGFRPVLGADYGQPGSIAF